MSPSVCWFMFWRQKHLRVLSLAEMSMWSGFSFTSVTTKWHKDSSKETQAHWSVTELLQSTLPFLLPDRDMNYFMFPFLPNIWRRTSRQFVHHTLNDWTQISCSGQKASLWHSVNTGMTQANKELYSQKKKSPSEESKGWDPKHIHVQEHEDTKEADRGTKSTACYHHESSASNDPGLSQCKSQSCISHTVQSLSC